MAAFVIEGELSAARWKMQGATRAPRVSRTTSAPTSTPATVAVPQSGDLSRTISSGSSSPKHPLGVPASSMTEMIWGAHHPFHPMFLEQEGDVLFDADVPLDLEEAAVGVAVANMLSIEGTRKSSTKSIEAQTRDLINGGFDPIMTCLDGEYCLRKKARSVRSSSDPLAWSLCSTEEGVSQAEDAEGLGTRETSDNVYYLVQKSDADKARARVDGSRQGFASAHSSSSAASVPPPIAPSPAVSRSSVSRPSVSRPSVSRPSLRKLPPVVVPRKTVGKYLLETKRDDAFHARGTRPQTGTYAIRKAARLVLEEGTGSVDFGMCIASRSNYCLGISCSLAEVIVPEGHYDQIRLEPLNESEDAKERLEIFRERYEPVREEYAVAHPDEEATLEAALGDMLERLSCSRGTQYHGSFLGGQTLFSKPYSFIGETVAKSDLTNLSQLYRHFMSFTFGKHRLPYMTGVRAVAARQAVLDTNAEAGRRFAKGEAIDGSGEWKPEDYRLARMEELLASSGHVQGEVARAGYGVEAPINSGGGADGISSTLIDGAKGGPDPSIAAAEGISEAPIDGAEGISSARIDGAEGIPSARIDGAEGIPSARIDGAEGIPSARVDGAEGIPSARIDGAEGIPRARIDGAEGIPSARIDGAQGISGASIAAAEGISEAPIDDADGMPGTSIDGAEGISEAHVHHGNSSHVAGNEAEALQRARHEADARQRGPSTEAVSATGSQNRSGSRKGGAALKHSAPANRGAVRGRLGVKSPSEAGKASAAKREAQKRETGKKREPREVGTGKVEGRKTGRAERQLDAREAGVAEWKSGTAKREPEVREAGTAERRAGTAEREPEAREAGTAEREPEAREAGTGDRKPEAQLEQAGTAEPEAGEVESEKGRGQPGCKDREEDDRRLRLRSGGRH